MRRYVFLLLVVFSAVIVSCGGNAGTNPPPTGSEKTVHVSIVNFAFSPADVTLNEGDTIVWTNNSSTLHTATSTGGVSAFNSGNLGNGQSFTRVFDQVGTTNYHCSLHPTQMTGIITVEAP